MKPFLGTSKIVPFLLRTRAHEPGARYFHYTTAHTICQEKNAKKIKQIIIPKFVYFDY